MHVYWRNITQLYYINRQVLNKCMLKFKLEVNWLVFNMNIDDIKNLPKANNLPAFYRDIIMCWVKTGGGQLPNA
jgi:hypothetical protein